MNFSEAVSMKNDIKGTVYLSGPMTGIEDYNFPAFRAMADKWADKGWVVKDPSRNFEGRVDLPYETYFREDIKILLECTALALLPGWEKSKGAIAERALAERLNLKIYDAETMELCDKEPGIQSPMLKLADELVSGARQKQYGSPHADFSGTAMILNGMGFRFESRHNQSIRQLGPEHIPLIMAAVKLSRTANHPDCYHWDSWVDLVGYSKTAEEIFKHKKLYESKKATQAEEQVQGADGESTEV